jgi:hypothetical protein
MKKLLPLILFLSTFLWAQTPTATLTGYVLDASGAAIHGAIVTVRNTSTGIEHQAKTDDSGAYQFLQLVPGVYKISTTAQNFETEQQSEVHLEVAQHARTDFHLQVGKISESVQVSSEATLTDTESAAVGTEIDNEKVQELPVNVRSFYSLALLAPGVALPAQNSTLGYRGGFNVAGSKEIYNTFTLNGADDNDEPINGPSYRPSVEAIQEFRVLTGVYSAEYGRTSGGQVVVVTKSGGNEFHGDLFEFLRNQIFDGRNYFYSGNTTPPYHRNQFGATLGGPIQKNKTFFFVNYEGLRLRQQIVALSTVPTNAMIGITTPNVYDFSSLLHLATPVHVKNPYTGKDFLTPNVITVSDLDGNGNSILANASSVLGIELAKFYPQASTATASGQAPGNNYNFSGASTEQMNEYSVKVDHTFSGKDSGFANYNYFDDPTFVPTNNQCNSNNYIPGFGCKDGLTVQLALLSETHVFTPTLLNEVRLNYERFRQSGIQQDVNDNYPALNGASSGAYSNNTGLPVTSVSGFGSLGGSYAMPQQRFDNTYQLSDTLTYLHHHHTFKVGADLRRADSLDNTAYYGRGSLTFTGGGSGYSLADLILGLPHTTQREPGPTSMRPYHDDLYLFATDDWKLNQNLSVNLGLRWEYDSPLRTYDNNLSGFDAANGTMIQAGANGVPNHLSKENKNNFAPRVGFSWQPLGKSSTVLHTGYGIFYNVPVLLQQYVNLMTQYPVRNPQTYTATSSSLLTLANPFPTSNTPGSRTATGIDPNYATSYAQEWTLGIQQSISKDTVVELSYVGSKGSKLPLERNINQAVLGAGGTVTENARRPYQNVFAGLSFGNATYLVSEGSASFHSLQAKLQKKYSGGLSALISYTFGRSIDEGAGGSDSSSDSSKVLPQNSYAPHSEKGLSDFDVRQRLVFSPVYDLPLGRGHATFNHGIAADIASAWRLSSIFQWQTGRPFTVYYGTDNSYTGENADRPNVVHNPNSNAPHRVSQWFNTSSNPAFSAAAAGTFGNESRNSIEGPGYTSLDLAIERNFAIRKSEAIVFRAEGYNLANHPNFYNPSPTTDTYGSGSFGAISTAFDPRQLQFSLKVLF